MLVVVRLRFVVWLRLVIRFVIRFWFMMMVRPWLVIGLVMGFMVV